MIVYLSGKHKALSSNSSTVKKSLDPLLASLEVQPLGILVPEAILEPSQSIVYSFFPVGRFLCS
jgi:hypothetical protein